MLLSIPILVEERPVANSQLTTFLVRPLFHSEPVKQADRLSRALNKLTAELHILLDDLGRNPRHDALAQWSFNPDLSDTTLDVRLELDRRSPRARFFVVGYKALDRTIHFSPLAPEVHFEVLPGQSLERRAAEVWTRHFREQERAGLLDADLFEARHRMRVTTLDLKIKPAAQGVVDQPPARALIAGGPRKKDGERELRKTGRSLQTLFPDDLHRAVRREEHVDELARLLSCPDRRPVLLVGPRKVGKTAILHELVWQICARKKERYGGGREIWLLSPMRLISGMSFVGEWENRVHAILDYARRKDKVLYFDDLLGLLTAGISSASTLNVAQVIQPALEKRLVRVLAEITPEAWRVLRERHRGLADLFHVIPVTETSEAQTLRILVSVVRDLEQQHQCEFSLAVVPMVYDLQRRFGGDAAFPGKAAGFLRALGVRFAGGSIDAARAMLEFQEQSGLHPAFLNDRISLTRQVITDRLRAQVVGQAAAIDAFADVLVKMKARLNDPRRPLGTFLLLGPTGVGKTQSAKALAAFLFGPSQRLLRFDMNEFVDGAAAARLVGTPQHPDGLLTGAIRRQPFSVVLFDEIEKATPEVFDLLLAVLDEGRLTDALGRTADFTHAIILLTSNLGAREARSQLGFSPDSIDRSDEVYATAAETFFRPEFFNRLDRVIPFRRLAPEHLQGIASGLIADVFSRDGLRRRECWLHVTPGALSWMVRQGHHPDLGARALKRVVEREVAQPLAVHLANSPPGTPTLAIVDAAGERLCLRLNQLEPVAQQVTWPQQLGAERAPARQKTWSRSALENAYRFLDRVEAQLAEISPSGRIEVSQVDPAQARYFYCREQCQKVRRVAQAAERFLERPRARQAASHLPKSKPTKVIVRSDSTGHPRLDRKRAATSLRLELDTLDPSELIEVPDSPITALFREAALLETMMARPADDRPVALLFRALDPVDNEAVGTLARVYREGVDALWGGMATLLHNLLAKEAPARHGSERPFEAVASEEVCAPHHALWCQGVGLSRLLPTQPGCILVRRRNGTLGVVFLESASIQSEEQFRAWVAERLRAEPLAPETPWAAVHLLEIDRTLTDFRNGLVQSATGSAEESRSFLLSSLPLPPELEL